MVKMTETRRKIKVKKQQEKNRQPVRNPPPCRIDSKVRQQRVKLVQFITADTHPCPTCSVLLAPHPQDTSTLGWWFKPNGPLTCRPWAIGTCHATPQVTGCQTAWSACTRICAHAWVGALVHRELTLSLLLLLLLLHHFLFREQIIV